MEESASKKYEINDGSANPPRLKVSFIIIALVMTVLLLVLIVVVLAVFVATKDSNTVTAPSVVTDDYTQQGQVGNVCVTPGCVSAAARIISNLDDSVHPCDDFSQFSCGGWLARNPLPEGKRSASLMGDLRAEVNIKVKRIIEGPSRPNEDVPIKNIKNLYKSCIDLDTMNERGDQHFRNWLIDSISPWPLISPNVTSSDLDLTEIAVNLAKYGYITVVAMYPGPDNKDSSKNIIQMDQSSPTLPQRYYLVPRNDTYLMAYENYIFRVADALGLADPEKGRKDVAAIVDFEILLAKNMVPAEQRRDANALYNPMTLGEFHGNYSSEYFDMKRYTLGVLSSDNVGITDITDDEIVINNSPQYFQNITDIFESTPKTTVANYMIWTSVYYMVTKLPKKYRDIYGQFYKDITGASINENERAKICTSFVEGKMGFAIGKQFIDDYVDPDAKDMATEMVSGLRSAFNELLDEIDWMDDSTKRVAREKSKAIKTKIAYPEFVANSTMLAEVYKNYTFSADEYFENFMRLQVVQTSEVYQRLRKPVDKDKWQLSPQTVNAYYLRSNNEIGLPSGILQAPVFSTDYPRYVTYGGLGAIIGHEITHGFDDMGRQYDKDGNVKQWWSPSVIDRFKNQKKCFIDQYGAYSMDEVNMTLNGINTQGENIADNGGLKQSYRAYKNWVASRGKEELTLPGLNYTVDQLFFISFGQLWCTQSTKGSTILSISSGVHSPGRYRTIGPPRNFDEFSKVFNCPRTSFMNSNEKCHVW